MRGLDSIQGAKENHPMDLNKEATQSETCFKNFTPCAAGGRDYTRTRVKAGGPVGGLLNEPGERKWLEQQHPHWGWRDISKTQIELGSRNGKTYQPVTGWVVCGNKNQT